MKQLLTFYACILACCTSYSQQSLEDIVTNQLSYYSGKQSQSLLYIHFDKNVYTPNETAWFTGYMVKTTAGIIHKNLNLLLIRCRDSSIIQQERFVINEGIATGSFIMEDSLEQGNYFFAGYTDVFNGKGPEAFFLQPITIKTPYEPAYTATLQLRDSITDNTTTAIVVLKAYTKDLTSLTSKSVSYTINSKLTKTTTDKNGEVVITVPVAQLQNNDLIQADLTVDKDVKHLQVRVPLPKKKVRVQFYPEGGNLVEGLASVTGWEAKAADGTPLLVQGVLLRNGIVQDTVATDDYGMGKLLFTPEKSVAYTFKLLGYDTDTVFNLPAVAKKGVVMYVPKALPKDTLVVDITSNITQRLYLCIHNYKELFYIAPLQLKQGKRQSFRMYVPAEMPRGITSVTIIDEQGKSIAERLVFMRFNDAALLNVSVNNKVYPKRTPVQLLLQLASDTVTKAVVSVACVQANRLLPGKMTDIASYMYLDDALAALPYKVNRMDGGDKNISYLENVLLVKGWRRYNWSEAMFTSVADTIHHYHGAIFKGRVTREGKIIKKPVVITIIGNGAIKILTTDSSGGFVLEQEDMEGQRLLLVVNDKQQDKYEIMVDDPYLPVNKNIAGYLPGLVIKAGSNVTTDAWALPKNERIKMLEDVTVKSGKNNSLFNTKNACGDYVCEYNILNCSNHFVGKKPVKGERYLSLVPGSNQLISVTYQGCNMEESTSSFVKAIKGLNTYKEFYVPDSNMIASTEPLLRSTLLWKHLVALNGKEAVQLSFYTGDVTGPFRIIVQGIGEGDVVYGETSFEVK